MTDHSMTSSGQHKYPLTYKNIIMLRALLLTYIELKETRVLVVTNQTQRCCSKNPGVQAHRRPSCPADECLLFEQRKHKKLEF